MKETKSEGNAKEKIIIFSLLLSLEINGENETKMKEKNSFALYLCNIGSQSCTYILFIVFHSYKI